MAHLMSIVLTPAPGHDQVSFNSSEQSRTIQVPVYTTPQGTSASSSSTQSQSTSTPRTSSSSATTPQTIMSDDRGRIQRHEEAYIERLRAAK